MRVIETQCYCSSNGEWETLGDSLTHHNAHTHTHTQIHHPLSQENRSNTLTHTNMLAKSMHTKDGQNIYKNHKNTWKIHFVTMMLYNTKQVDLNNKIIFCELCLKQSRSYVMNNLFVLFIILSAAATSQLLSFNTLSL